MIIYLFLSVITTMIGFFPAMINLAVQALFPSFSFFVSTLPFGIDPVLTAGIGYFNFIKVLFPPLQLMWEAFVFIIIFKLALKLVAMIPIIRNVLYK